MTPKSPLAAQLAQLRELTRQVLPSVAADRALSRALKHAQGAVEDRLGLPRETPPRRGGHG